MRENILELLTKLRLKGMENVLDRELDRAEKEGSPVSEAIHRILMEEWAYRQERSLHYRISQAKIPWQWTLETFPFHRQPSVNRAQIKELAGLSFLDRMQNIVFPLSPIGDPGTGKSGLAYCNPQKSAHRPDIGPAFIMLRISSMNSMPH